MTEIPRDQLSQAAELLAAGRDGVASLLNGGGDGPLHLAHAYLEDAETRLEQAGAALDLSEELFRTYLGAIGCGEPSTEPLPQTTFAEVLAEHAAESAEAEEAYTWDDIYGEGVIIGIEVVEMEDREVEVPIFGEVSADDLAFARRILGEDFDFDPDVPYDEFRAILNDVLRAREKMRAAMVAGAEAAGIEIDPEMVANWVPSDDELKAIRHNSRAALRMLAKIRGVADFMADQADEARQQGVPLRPHQQLIFKKFYNFLRYMPRTDPEGGKSGLVGSPTGTGKTALFARIVAAMLYGEDANDPERFLVLEPRQKLLDQTMGREGERGFGMFAPDLDVTEFWQMVQDLTGQVVVMTTASFDNLMRQGKMPFFHNVVVDEVQTAISGVTGRNLRTYIRGKTAYGCSATLEYDEERSAYKVFKHKIHEMSLPEAIRGGLCAPTRGYLHDVKPVIDESRLPLDPAARRAAIRAAYLEAWIQEAAKIVNDGIVAGVGSIIKCPPGGDVDVAVQVAKRLRDQLVRVEQGMIGTRWINAAFVGGSAARQKRVDRDLILEAFNRGELDAIAHVKAVDIGFDTNHGKRSIDLAPGESRVSKIQNGGRTERVTFDEHGKPIWAEWHDFKDPFLGDKQYTCLDALELTESGQGVDHDPVQLPIPVKKNHVKKRHIYRPEVEEVVEKNVTSGEVDHQVAADKLTQEDLAKIAAAHKKGKVEFSEACRILGVSPPTLRDILTREGYGPKVDIDVDDLMLILEVYPGIQAEPLPIENRGDYIPALEAKDHIRKYVRSFTLLSMARMHGILPHRFMVDGKVGFYFKRESLPALQAMFDEDKK